MDMAYVRCEASDDSPRWQHGDKVEDRGRFELCIQMETPAVVGHAAGARLGERQGQGFRFGNKSNHSALC